METIPKNVNPIFTTQAILKVADKIKKNQQGSENNLRFIKEQCISSDDAVVSLASSKALIYLAENDVIPLSATLSELVSAIPIAKSFIGITAAICGLLQLDLQYKLSKNQKYKCGFNLSGTPHPLISILIQRQDEWTNIFSKISGFYKNEKTSYYANELLFPLYMYVICNPTHHEVTELFQHKLWHFLIRNNKEQSKDVILHAAMWLQTSTKKHSLTASYLLMDFLELQAADHGITEIIIVWLSSIVYDLINHGHDPRNSIASLDEAIKTCTLDNLASCTLIMLAQSIPICPIDYLCDLLHLCKNVIVLNKSNMLALQMTRLALLQWLAFDNVSSNSSPLIKEILLRIEDNKTTPCTLKQLYSNKMFYILKSTNQHIHLAFELSILSVDNILEWLNRNNKFSCHSLKNVYHYLGSLLLCNFNSEITLEIIKSLLKISDVYNEITTNLLTLILHKLSHTTDPNVHYSLLKALPKMGVVKENLPLIINTLEALRNGMFSMKSFVVTLFFDLWQIDPKCFLQLQNVLMEEQSAKTSPDPWELQVTKAYVLKQLCIKQPEIHGTELVGHLSNILNTANSKKGAIQSTLALEGIAALCNAGIIDIESTWSELSPHFDSEQRIIVIESLCRLMTEVSYLEPSNCPTNLLQNVITKLWEFTKHLNTQVVRAAFKALQCFTLEQVLEYLPEYLISEQGTDDCWIKLLSNSNIDIDAAGDFLIKFVNVEITAYHSGTYEIKGNREPQNLNYLPSNSIVRVLGNYIRKQVQNRNQSTTKQAYLQCLRVLSQEYSRPLPPTDWCFLQELVHDPETRSYCITLAAHQVQLSGTARRLVENFILAVTKMENNDEDIVTVYKTLTHLSNSIQPIIIRPFVESSLTYALEKIQSHDYLVFDVITAHLRITLDNKMLQDSNKCVLSQVIINFARNIEPDCLTFQKLLDCIVKLPVRYIDELSSPRLWKEETDKQMKLCVKVRCALAMQESVSPLMWLNDVIDAACHMPLMHNYVLLNIAEVMEAYRDSEFAVSWFLELLRHINSIIANQNTSTYQREFFCDLYMTVILVLSGQDIFTTLKDLVALPEPRLRLFPQSVGYLMQKPCWSNYVLQISEWLFHMSNYNGTPEKCKVVFFQALASLRHQNSEQSLWLKYVGNSVNLTI